jgi:hypothetical protein
MAPAALVRENLKVFAPRAPYMELAANLKASWTQCQKDCCEASVVSALQRFACLRSWVSQRM